MTSQNWLVAIYWYVACSTLVFFPPFDCCATPRDLNKNGKLDKYEDPTQPVEARVDDLLSQMSIEEKAGQMFVDGAPVNSDGSLDRDPSKSSGFAANLPAARDSIETLHMTHFNVWSIPDDVLVVAKWHNRLQKFAESQRLGIPLTIASDPRNHFSSSVYSVSSRGFSMWPEPIGLAAIGDETLAEQFGDFVRREYLAVGFREALHPQIDLATEPRWPRISGGFGEDAELTSRLAAAYIRGLQGTDLKHGVACMTKHFPGGGPQNGGLDPHFPFQKGQVYPGKNFGYHLIPFEAAIRAGTSAIMPYYGVPIGQTDENVAMAFNRKIITSLLREKYKYEGVVCSDWGVISDLKTPDFTWPARAWGVENLSELARVQKAIEAGLDQFGGERCPELICELVRTGAISETRIDQSIRRLLRQKFQLGLFDNPYVDEDRSAKVFAEESARMAGEAAQRRSFTLLKNESKFLPRKKESTFFVKNVDPQIASRFGKVVDHPKDADFAILRIATPFVPYPSDIPFATMFHHGDLDFKEPALAEILEICRSTPTIVDINLDRPAVIPEISRSAKTLLANYGASDAALLDIIFGVAKPEGRLPFELPSSMDAVRNQKADVPHDSKDPLYPIGAGLRYE